MRTHAVTVEARRVLLDALDALAPHLDSLVLVGAQAVHVHTAGIDLGVAPYTTDGDLVIDPTALADAPLIHEALAAAGFSHPHSDRQSQPGTWTQTTVVEGADASIDIDLLVPAAFVPPSSRRSVPLGAHGRAARRTPGLEPALVDNAPRSLSALDPDDPRRIEVRVAGPAALLVAKAFKLRDRLTPGTRPDRLDNKDAGDAVNIMRTTRVEEVADTYRQLLTDERVAPTASEGLDILDRLFGARAAVGVDMAVSNLVDLRAADIVRAVAPAYVAELRRLVL